MTCATVPLPFKFNEKRQDATMHAPYVADPMPAGLLAWRRAARTVFRVEAWRSSDAMARSL